MKQGNGPGRAERGFGKGPSIKRTQPGPAFDHWEGTAVTPPSGSLTCWFTTRIGFVWGGELLHRQGYLFEDYCACVDCNVADSGHCGSGEHKAREAQHCGGQPVFACALKCSVS